MGSKRFELKGCLWILDSCDRPLRFHTPFYVGSDGTQTVLIQIEISQRFLTRINLLEFRPMVIFLTGTHALLQGKSLAVILFGESWGACSQSWLLHAA